MGKTITWDSGVTVNNSITDTSVTNISSVSMSTDGNMNSPIDYTLTYTSPSTITISNITTSEISKIVYINIINNNTIASYVHGVDGVIIGVISNIITIYKNGILVSPFKSDDTYQSSIVTTKLGYDRSTNSHLFSDINPPWTRYTDSEPLVTEQDLTDTYAKLSNPISTIGYNLLNLRVVADTNNSEDVTIKVVELDSIDGTDEYELSTDPTITIWSGTVSDFKKSFPINVSAFMAVQLYIKAETVGTTAGDVTINFNKVWSPTGL